MSGLIYAVIVAAWAGVLVPRWLRRNEEIEQAREADAARGVRVLERRDERHNVSHRPSHRHGSTLFRGTVSPSEGMADASDHASEAANRPQPDSPARRPAERPASVPIVIEPDHEYEQAARRRSKVFAVLIAATVVVSVTAAIGVLPIWTPAPIVVLLGAFLVAARRAAVAQMYRRRHQMRQATRALERETETETEVDDDEAPRIAVFDAPAPEPEDPDAWSPVDVPLPTYMTKPAVRRLERTIDLSAAGSWTSGRLDPASAIELPSPRSADAPDGAGAEPVDEELDDTQEQRRAVGD